MNSIPVVPRIVGRWLFRLVCGLALALTYLPGAVAQIPVSAWGSHTVIQQTGTDDWAFFAVDVPADHPGFLLTASRMSGTSPVELFVRRGSVNPTESEYSWRSTSDDPTLELGPGELTRGEYRIGLHFRGSTPLDSAQHRFRLIPSLNPAGGQLTVDLAQASDLLFRLVAPGDYTGFQSVLTKTNDAGVELSTFRGGSMETAQMLRASEASGPTVETVWSTDLESQGGTNWLRLAGVAAGTNSVTLRWRAGFATTLAWDPGTADEGTEAFVAPADDPGGLHIFRVHAQATDLGAWRTVLRVPVGQATFKMQAGLPPPSGQGYAGVAAGAGTPHSARLFYEGGYTAGQDWFVAVNAQPGSQWRLVSGRAYAQRLDRLLDPDTTAGNNTIDPSQSAAIGPEGVRFFQVTIPANTPAWRLWANNGDVAQPRTLARDLEVRANKLPVPGQGFDLRQEGQMLVVPPYLNQADAFFVAVSGDEGTLVNLDSRRQRIELLDFGEGVEGARVDGFRYRTYRVDVPADVIGWQVTARPSRGDVDLALRKNEVGNEHQHTAYAEAEGLVGDSLTLVPAGAAGLRDGTYYITVVGKNAAEFALGQDEPRVTPMRFVNSPAAIPGYTFPTDPPLVNDEPDRNGWRYYMLPNDDAQLGAVGWGWLLQLAHQVPGTEIALRRNFLPGRWSGRLGGGGGAVDFSSTGGFLERQDHQKDVWYVGIYTPRLALGTYQLETRPFLPVPGTLDRETPMLELSASAHAPGRWEYFQIDIPEASLTPAWVACEIQLIDPSGGDLVSVLSRGGLPHGQTPWPNVGGVGDWTGRPRPHGLSDYFMFPMQPTGDFMSPGLYYLGVWNRSGEVRSYRVRVARVGYADQPEQRFHHEIRPLALTGLGSRVAVEDLAPREFRLFRLDVDEDLPMLRLGLEVGTGEARLRVPYYGSPEWIGSQALDVAREGSELMTRLPQHAVLLERGAYFVAVVAEGAFVPGAYALPAVGTGPTDAVLSVLPPRPPTTDLGTFVPGQEQVVEVAFTPPEIGDYTMTIPEGVQGFEMVLEGVRGSTVLQFGQHTNLPPINGYGWIGGLNGYQSLMAAEGGNNLLNLIPPTPGTYRLVFGPLDGAPGLRAARLTLRALAAPPLDAADGTVAVIDHPSRAWRFFRVDIPETLEGAAPAAWDLRLLPATASSVAFLPYLVVRRDAFPWTVGGGLGSLETAWPPGAWMMGDAVINGRSVGGYSGHSQVHRPWGLPVEPGTYYVGLYNADNKPVSYRVRSRLVGAEGTARNPRVEPLPWGEPGVWADIRDLPTGEARYFRISVPEGTPMMRLRVTEVRGEARMIVGRRGVPGTHLWNELAYEHPGDGIYALLPPAGTNVIPAGDYDVTLAAIAPAEVPGSLGEGTVDLKLERLPDVQAVDLGVLRANETLPVTNRVQWPERNYFTFTVPPGSRSLQIRAEQFPPHQPPIVLVRAGAELLASRANQQPPPYTDPRTADTWQGGQPHTWMAAPDAVINDPAPGVYTIMVDYAYLRPPEVFDVISLTLTSESEMDFLNGSAEDTFGPAAWRYYKVVVPEDAAAARGVCGWEVRLAHSPSEEPWRLIIRRDELPPGGPAVGPHATDWPTGGYYSGMTYGTDFTGRAIPGLSQSYSFYAIEWGNPLRPGTYYVGVQNQSATERRVRLTSRAIGEPGHGLPIEIETVPLGAKRTITGLPAGSAQYFRVDLPVGLGGCRWQLRTLQGDARWRVRRGHLPNPGDQFDPGQFPEPGWQVSTAWPGNEHMVWWPTEPETTLPADAYFVVVAAEGVPAVPDQGWLGTGETSFEFSAEAFVPVDLGSLGAGGPLMAEAAFEAGQVLAHEFVVPEGARAVEVRLENRVGQPSFTLGYGAGLFWSGGGYNLADAWGGFGMPALDDVTENTVVAVVPNPRAGRYWIASGFNTFAGNRLVAPQAGSFTLLVRGLPVESLNFSARQNPDGGTNVVQGTLAGGERRFFSVDIPETIEGESVLGWHLKLERSQGNPLIMVRPGALLPEESTANESTYPTGQDIVVAPPYFRPGRWTVAVLADGASAFTLTSERVVLERPAWTMQAVAPSPAPAAFADTGQVDLAQDGVHFYAVDVPEGNGGLWRAALNAENGNPDLFVRALQVPSTQAARDWQTGAFDFSLVGLGSKTANWVPASGRAEHQLRPGRWFLMVRATGGNTKYQLNMTTGEVTALALQGGQATGQTLEAGDWRYYRFEMPENPPQFWDLTVTQERGDIAVFFRDSIPPGESTAGEMSWRSDGKNNGVDYPHRVAPGSWRFTTPMIRPGQAYYVGVKARVDSTFSIASSTSGPALDQVFPPFEFIDAAGGAVSVTLAPFERRTWRIRTPADALRLKLVGTHSSAVGVYVQNGAPPWASRNAPADHDAWFDSPNILREWPLLAPDPAAGPWSDWPWIRGHTFYVAATNSAAEPQPLALTVDTRFWRLDLAGAHGTVTASPNKTSYEHGDIVSLTPTPAPGYRFVGWGGDLAGAEQPGQLAMTGHRRVEARFELISDPPVITGQPADQTRSLGGRAVLTVTAEGSAPLSYRWRKGGLDLNDGGTLSGATTPRLTIESVLAADAGSYDVVVTNDFGSATSQVATLTVQTGGGGNPDPLAAPSGLVAWWRGEDNALDGVGSNDGLLRFGTGFEAGRVGRAFSFDGVDDQVLINGTLAGLRGATGITVMAWVRKPNLLHPHASFFGKWNHDFLLYNGEGDFVDRGAFLVHFSDGTGPGRAVGSAPMPVDEWVHVAGTWQSADGFLGLYQNGELSGSATQGAGQQLQFTPTVAASIGEAGLAGNPLYQFEGQIDEVAVFNRALGAEEIRRVYEAGAVGFRQPVGDGNAVRNGSFEEPATDTYLGFGTGDTLPGGWKVETTTSRLYLSHVADPFALSYWPATEVGPAGVQFAYLADSAGATTLSQELAEPLKGGVEHVLAFLQTGTSPSGFPQEVTASIASLTSGEEIFRQVYRLVTGTTWTRRHSSFTPPRDDRYVLRLIAVPGYLAVVDDIVIRPAQPAAEVRLQLDLAAVASEGKLRFSLPGLRGRTVRIEASSDLEDWDEVGQVVVETGAETFSEPMTGARHFYRALTLP